MEGGKGVCDIEGRIVPLEQATLPLLDLGLLRGYAVFDYLRTYQRRPFHLKEHFFRLRYSAAEAGLSFAFSFQEIEDRIERLIEALPGQELGIKLFLTAGISQDQFLPQGKEQLFLFAYPYSPYPSSFYQSGIALATLNHLRPFPHIKSAHYLAASSFLAAHRKKGFEEILYVTERGEVLESGCSNFFAICDNRLISCSGSQVLMGITQAVIETLCYPLICERRLLMREELKECQEAFISSSSREIIPVIRIDEEKIGSGKVGPEVKRLMLLFSQYTQQSHWPDLKIQRYKIT
jgi:branched-chain amino acid aminotransferase